MLRMLGTYCASWKHPSLTPVLASIPSTSRPSIIPTTHKASPNRAVFRPRAGNCSPSSGWEEKGDLAACAAGVEIGMIDTLVDEHHRFFAGTQIKSINLALKQDAPPAPHWHATGVLSVMVGLPNGNTPALIPGARFTAINVFFTNKDGQLETDTAHLTEAL